MTNLIAITVWGAPNIYGLKPSDVNAIQAYWTGTGKNDVIVTTAGARVPYSSVVALCRDETQPKKKERKRKKEDKRRPQ